MKQSILIFLIGFTISYGGYAQEEKIHHDVPSSPAFSILDFEPTSVLRPTSPSELTTNILTSFDENGKLNPNIGLEFAPYWLKSKPELTLEQFNDPDTWQTIQQTFRLSFANVQDTAIDQSLMGVGFRFQLIQGKLPQSATDAIQLIQSRSKLASVILGIRALAQTFINKQSAIDKIVLEARSQDCSDAAIAELYTIAEDVDPSYAKDTTNTRSEIQAFAASIYDQYLALNINDELIDQTREKAGLIIELGGASSFQTKQPGQDGGIRKLGFWATASEKINEQNQFVFSARYMKANVDSVESNFDVGLSFVKDVENISLSFEAVARWYEVQFKDVNAGGQFIDRIEDDFTYRLSVNANYKLSKSIFVNASFGRNYANGVTQQSGFFSILGVNYNLFRPTTITDIK
ncbi:hypothetical protein N6H18_14935 [Reichenbachiella agarivorans]|uniref:Outer membrane protein beta-barrel family protein n=1 Tax=Reichenbachiella agarivorans TaxID=2979464 RepID=A0ABY6CM93_9BACT|nr:hypothetical protein [Reichenbachiella agarivorans]UXP31642.1 hypothetical protein N6H18_14935 [Reichenbachiella agarivorans]